MLTLDLSPGQSIEIGDGIIVTMKKKTGQVCRLAIEADKSVPIRRVDQQEGQAPKSSRSVVGITGLSR